MGNAESLTIPTAVAENTPSTNDGFTTVMGRSTSGVASACPSLVYMNTAGIYALEQNIDLNSAIPSPFTPTSYQVLANGVRYYGWVAPGLVVAADSRDCLCLGDTSQFSSQGAYLSQALVTIIGNMSKVMFAYKGSIESFTDNTGIFAKLTPNASAAWKIACLPLFVSVIGQQIYCTTDAGYDAATGNPYFLHPSLIEVAPYAVTHKEFGVVELDTSTTNGPLSVALGASATSALSNPFDDPPNPAVNVAFNGPTGVTSTPKTSTTFNVKIGSATYSLKYPYWFWVVLVFTVIFIILLVILLIVIRHKEIKYTPSKRAAINVSSTHPVRNTTAMPNITRSTTRTAPPLR